jgi:eukaryotic-like serine/threonine-protein kinase
VTAPDEPSTVGSAAGERVIAGKFRVGERIGRGGMGTVFAGLHLELGVPVAIKLLHDSGLDSDDARARFHREARAAAQLRSPHVVQVLDYGIDGDVPYLVMERLVGEDLGSRLRRVKRLSLADASHLLGQACKALKRAEAVGIVHRDLKPGNLFLAEIGDDETLKILDFGIAKRTGARPDSADPSTATGALLGSPAYMSPEQLRGQRELVDHRSDLWSLGVIMFRALTGHSAFSGQSIGDLVIQICVEPLPVASKLAPALPPAVDRFFEKALARKPAERFQSAAEMAAAFAAIAAAPREEARPPVTEPAGALGRAFSGTTLPLPALGPPRRDPFMLYIGAFVVLLALIAAGTLGWDRLQQFVDDAFDQIGPSNERR